MNWNRVIAIARWEYFQKVRSKAFLLTLLLLPIIIGGFILVPSLVVSQDPDSAKLIGIVDRVGGKGEELGKRIEEEESLKNGNGAAWLPKLYQGSDSTQAQADALAEAIEGYVVLSGSGDSIQGVYYSTNPSNFRAVSAVQGAVHELITAGRLADAGIDTATYNRLNRAVDVEARKISESGTTASDFQSTFWSGYIGIMLFMLLILTTGQSLVRGLVEEKSNRIIEMLVGAGTPAELMWGKLIGLSGLGLTQMAVWLLLGGGVALILPIAMNSPIGFDSSLLAPLPWVLLYLVLGYFFYASLFVGIGSLVTTEQEAQMVTQYLTFVIVVPIALSIGVIADPEAGWVEGLSYIPFLTPTMMMLRVVVKMPSTTTLIGTIGVMLVSTTVVTWVASKVFRTAILLYGKRPSVREIVRWLKE